MASRDFKRTLSDKYLLMSVPSYKRFNPDSEQPSCVVVGGATSPALAFKMYSKGSKIPQTEFHEGQFMEFPLDSFVSPTMPEQVMIQSKVNAERIAILKAEADRIAADEAAAKQADIDAKVAYAEKHMAAEAAKNAAKAD